jgi:hypothetical protein
MGGPGGGLFIFGGAGLRILYFHVQHHPAAPRAEASKNNLRYGAERGILDSEGVGALDLKRIEGEHSIQQDSAAINTAFPQQGHTRNCGNCAIAYELRRQGYDVEAQAGDDMYFGDFTSMFDGARVQRLAQLSTTEDAHEMARKIEQDILSWGEGARGAIRGNWLSENGGHYFSAEVRGGKVMFVDGQIGKDNVRYLEYMTPQNIDYVRLDNTKPTDNVKKAVKNRR